MLNDKEKKAIEVMKEVKARNVHTFVDELSIVLNLIEKQSKEIEELKEKDDANLAYYDQIYQNGIYTGQKAVEEKIKAKIEELENEKEKYFEKQVIQHEIEILQSLLEKE